jgi:hypothetical protein
MYVYRNHKFFLLNGIKLDSEFCKNKIHDVIFIVLNIMNIGQVFFKEKKPGSVCIIAIIEWLYALFSFTNKYDRHDITLIFFFKVMLNTNTT